MTKFNEDERALLGLGMQLEQQARALEPAPDAPQDEQA